MKISFLTFLLLCFHSWYAQPLYFRGNKVDSLVIYSNVSAFQFDDDGTTKGVYDRFLVIYNMKEGEYILDSYDRYKYDFSFRKDRSRKKIRTIKQGEVVDREKIIDLFDQLEKGNVEPSLENIGITEDEFKSLVSKRKIHKAASSIKTRWIFRPRYSTRDEVDAIYRGCQSVDSFNVFLAKTLTFGPRLIVSDFDDHFSISIVTSTNKYTFLGDTYSFLKQPWNVTSDEMISPSPQIINLGINSALLRLLPSGFSRIEALDVRKCMVFYIKWYLNGEWY